MGIGRAQLSVTLPREKIGLGRGGSNSDGKDRHELANGR